MEEETMKKTFITPKLLMERGFKEMVMSGGIVYVKGIVGVAYNTFCMPYTDFDVVCNISWIPCNMETKQPLTPGPIRIVTTFEELDLLVQEAGIRI